MDPLSLILLVWFLVAMPIMIAQMLLMYFSFYHRPHNLLLRMIYQMPKRYQQSVTREDHTIRRWYFGFFTIFFLVMNLVVAYLTYWVLGYGFESRPPFYSLLIWGTLVFLLVIYIPVLKQIRKNSEYRVWTKILEEDGIRYDDIQLKLDWFSRRKQTKLVILARSYFKEKYPNVNQFVLPKLKFRRFQPPKIDDDQSDYWSQPQLKADLQLSNLWIDEKKSIVYPFGGIATISYLVVILVSVVYQEEVFRSINQISIIYISSILIGLVSVLSVSYIQSKFRMINERKAKLILKSQGIEYEDEDLKVHISNLLDQSYPYVNLDKYRIRQS